MKIDLLTCKQIATHMLTHFSKQFVYSEHVNIAAECHHYHTKSALEK